MKTNYFTTQKVSIYTLFGSITLLLASCGSSQNSSYYDNDGIYGSSSKSSKNEVAASDNKYKEYFSNLNQENQEIFTDVENYSTTNDSVAKTTEATNNAWGANPSTTTVIVYDNYWGGNWAWNNWYGPSWGWGWNSWYGPSWGWGWNSWYGPNYYWGWNYPYYGGYYGNYWGWNSPYYGGYYGYYNHNYAYANGRRDTRSYYNGMNRYGISGRNQSTVTPTRYTTPSRNTSGLTRDYNNTGSPRPRTYTTGTPRPTTPVRDYNSSQNPRPNATPPTRDYNTTTTSPRPAPSTQSTRDYTPSNTQSTRDYTPSRSSDTRSYTPSYGGGSGGGGGRSGGGGGGGRR